MSVGLAVLVAATRVTLGVHWLTDVIAGLCLGWTWFAATSIAFGGRRLQFAAPLLVADRSVGGGPSGSLSPDRPGGPVGPAETQPAIDTRRAAS